MQHLTQAIPGVPEIAKAPSASPAGALFLAGLLCWLSPWSLCDPSRLAGPYRALHHGGGGEWAILGLVVCWCYINTTHWNAPCALAAVAAWCASHPQLEYLGNRVFSVTGPDWGRHRSDSQWNGAANMRPTYCWRNRGFHGRGPKQCQVIWLPLQPKAVNFRMILTVSLISHRSDIMLQSIK